MADRRREAGPAAPRLWALGINLEEKILKKSLTARRIYHIIKYG